MVGRLALKIQHAWKRMLRWWSIYSLSLSWGRFMGGVGSITTLLCLGTLNYFLVSHYIFSPVQVVGSSMYPTLINTDYYWLDRLAYLVHDPKPGDIVALRDPSGHGFDVKRIVATPEQTIYIRGGKVYVNDTLYKEPYLPQKLLTFAYESKEDEMWCLAPGQFFVMGDNRGNSCDSRTFGPIKRSAILGKVMR